MDLRKLQFIKNGVDVDKAIKSGGLVYDKKPKKEEKWKEPNMKGFKYGRQTGM